MKKGVKVLISIILALAVASGAVCLGVTFIGKNYKQAEDTQYKILQVTDPHILNDEKKDAKAYKTITEMVKSTQPDLIMVTGDITSEKENFTAFKSFGAFMEEFKIPWGFVFGNHEGLDVKYENGEGVNGETIADKQMLSDYLESLEYCIYQAGDESVDGMGNYTYSVKDKDGNILNTLIMMDSHSWDSENEGYDHFHENQVDWYENTVKEINLTVNGNENTPANTLAFFHVPMQEGKIAYDSKDIVGGKRLEKEGCPAVDDMMFEKMAELGSTKACFFGHDHMNNYEVERDGIRLCYGLSCDHNIYIVPFRGGKLINIKSDGSFTTQSLIRHRGQSTITIGKEK